MTYKIVRRGELHVVVDTDTEGGRFDEEYGTREEAVARILALGEHEPTLPPLAEQDIRLQDAAQDRAERDANPEIQEQRRIKAAYRLAERDPVLKAIKIVFPKKGQAERNTQHAYERMLEWIGAHASVASSDPARHKMLNYTPQRRQTAAAAQAKRQQREITYQRALDLKKQGKSTSAIAQELGVSDRYIRKLLNSK